MKRNIMAVSAVLILLVLLAKVLAFVRDPLVAALFGADHRTDAFFTALTITTFLFSFVAPTITASIIPLFIQERDQHGTAEAWRKFSGIVTLMAMVLVLSVAVLGLVAPWVVQLVSAGSDVTTQVLTVRLVRIMSPLLVAMPLSFFVSALLNAEKRFYLPGALPLIGNAMILVVIVLLYKTAGIGAVAWGTLVGAVVQLLLVAGAARSRLVVSRVMFAGLAPLFRQIGAVGWPVFAAAVVFNLNFLVMMHLSSYQADGTYSFLTYGLRIQQVFLDLLFASLATVIFPFLSDLARSNDRQQLGALSLFGMKSITVALVPVSVLLIVLRVPLIEIVYQRSAGLPSVVLGISTALAFFSFSLVAFGVVEIFNRIFFAQKDTRTPLLITIIGTTTALLWYLAIGKTYNGLGLALAYSLGAIMTAVVGLVAVHRRLSWTSTTFVPFLGQVFLAGGLCGLAAYGVFAYFGPAFSPTLTNQAIRAALSAALGLVVFGASLRLLKVKELTQLGQLFSPRLSRHDRGGGA